MRTVGESAAARRTPYTARRTTNPLRRLATFYGIISLFFGGRYKRVVAMSNEKKKCRMAYFIACVSEFARAHGLAHHESFDYLDRYKGMDFLVKCYEAEHTLSFADAVNDLNIVCRRHGGRI